MKKELVLYLVVPCYNEEEIIAKTADVMGDKLCRLISQGQISNKSKILFVNDGSRDATLEILHSLHEKNPMIGVLSFITNYGHQSAILAGMLHAKKYADVVITIDADLQQDIEAIDLFLDAYKKGADIVCGVRNDRNTDTFLKKTTALVYYKFMQILGCKLLTNHADYRLVSKRVLNVLEEYEETNLFLRGLIMEMGFQYEVVYFDVSERTVGESKYTFKKMLKLALDGITSMSVRPLRVVSGIGMITIVVSVILMISTLVSWIQGKTVQGYTTLLLVVLAIGGVIMLSLGIIGEYIGKIYMETKKRPRYIIDSVELNEEWHWEG